MVSIAEEWKRQVVDRTKVKVVKGASCLAQLNHPRVVVGNVMIQTNAPVAFVKRRYCGNIGHDPFKVGGVMKH